MTDADRLLNTLPLNSTERQLLLAGRADHPPPGDVDLDWQALTLVLGAAALTTTVGTGAAAVTTLSAAGAGTAIPTGLVHAAVSPAAAAAAPVHAAAASAVGAMTAKAAGASLGLSVVAKAVTIGFAVGMGLIGAGTAVSKIRQSDEPPSPTSSKQPAVLPSVSATPSRHRARDDAAQARPLEPSRSLDEVPTLATALPSTPKKRLASAPVAADVSPAPRKEASAALPPLAAEAPSQPLAPVASRTPSLAEQAGDLARVKRLIDSGEPTEAIRRLQISFTEGMHPALSEERDALYVQALTSAQMRAQAVLFAKRFLARYPNSPHAGTMRNLITAK